MRATYGETRRWIAETLDADTDACRVWPFDASVRGYAQVRRGGRTRQVTHLILIGSGRPRPSAPGDHALHSCDTPGCCNPRHLRWGTNQENVDDMVSRRSWRHLP